MKKAKAALTITLLALVVASVMILVTPRTKPSTSSQPPQPTQGPVLVAANSVRILGKDYSPRLIPLLRRVQESYDIPITATLAPGAGSETEITQDGILLRLTRDASEDVVAHELMHNILHAEGYPGVFCVSISPRAMALHKLMVESFDHLIINERCLDFGYDCRRGFISHKPSYSNLLTIELPTDRPDDESAAIASLLHQLIKFVYYVGDTNAERAILGRFLMLAPYWNQLSTSIQTFRTRPTPRGMWKVIEAHSAVLDKVAADLQSSFRIPELIGFGPVLLLPSEKVVTANEIFEQTYENIGQGRVLVRLFLRKSRIMVDVRVLPSDAKMVSDDLLLPVGDFVAKRQIQVRYME